MQSEHRKIELQSPGDLTYLTSQIRAAARQKLDLHLPAQPSDAHTPDDLRAQTEALVDAFVAQVLRGLKSNMCINGIDVISAARGGGFGLGDDNTHMEDVQAESVPGVEEEDFEPFDDKLRARLADHVARRDKLVAAISKHRRETPAASARRFEDAFEREAAALEGQNAMAEESARVLADADALGAVGMERQDEVRRNWERAVEGLGRLNKGLPETRARLERCGDVVGYLGAGEK